MIGNGLHNFSNIISTFENKINPIIQKPYIGVKIETSSPLSTYFEEFSYIVEYTGDAYCISWFKNNMNDKQRYGTLLANIARNIPGDIVIIETDSLEKISLYIMGSLTIHLYGSGNEIPENCGCLQGTIVKHVKKSHIEKYTSNKLNKMCQKVIKL